MATFFQVVEGGVVVNVLRADDGSALANNVITTPEGVIPAGPNQTIMQQTGAGMRWTLDGNGVLIAPTPAFVAMTKDQLVAYANAYQWNLATGGHTVTVGGQAILFPTDTTSMSLIEGKVARLGRPNAPTSINWQTGPTSYITISADDFLTAATAVADWIQSTFDAAQPVLAGIEAGSISTAAQIEAASWPTR